MENKNKIELIVITLARKKIISREDFLIILKNLTKKYATEQPSNVKIMEIYKKLRLKNKIKKNIFIENRLKKRPVRSLSGVAVVSVLTKPYPCPGKCVYCPTEKGFPKSYLAGEPAAERAKNLKYDPYNQVKKRIEVLNITGHKTDKIELIVIGASWTAYPQKYKTWFIKRCFDGANNSKGKNLEEAQKKNEKAKNRIISLSIETRPDLITLDKIKEMRQLGVTKIELGIQTLNEKVLKKNKRGHGLKEVIGATKMLKNAGFKICYHFMPNLYGSNIKNDLAMFKKMFTDENFRPDYLKIYPCVVVKGSPLYKLWQQKKYNPYTEKQLIDLLIQMKKNVPPYVRIIRVFRDIPSQKIEAGTKTSNLRELIQAKMKKSKLKCRCIRCREVKDFSFKISDLRLIKRSYQASEGKEIFLSFEDKKNDKLLAFLRLRLNGSTFQSIIRELHTYGEVVKIGKKKKGASQHKNLGKKLVEEAEKITKKSNYKKIVIIAGIGSRKYWQKLGYKPEETYMVKKF